jgi:hypothetical protein
LSAVAAFQFLDAPFLAIMLGFMAFNSYQQLQARRW